MEFSKYICAEQILLNCEIKDKASLISALVDSIVSGPFAKANPSLSRESIQKAILDREAKSPTVVASGTACPHARLHGIEGIGVACAVLKTPIDFGDPQQKPVDIVIALILPSEQPPLALKLLANVAQFGSAEQRASLLNAKNPKDAAELLCKLIFDCDKPLCARDFMRIPRCRLTPDTPVTTIVNKMVELNLDAMGIYAPDGALAGEVSADRLFMLGMPDFFSQLKSVSFIREFDPFAHYFEKEIHLTAREVMSTDIASVEEDATIIEIIFLLAVKRHQKVYVVREGKLVGVIDRARVLNEILNT